jgi:plastocyanin
MTAGLNFTSFSEIVPATVTGNETEYWLKRAFPLGERAAVAAIAAYNSAAGSVDGALSTSVGAGPLAVFGEVRVFSDRAGSGEAGSAGAVGALLRLTPYLGVTGDVGRIFGAGADRHRPWSAGLAMEIPGSPHTMSFHASNGGATTLQGASHEKAVGPKSVRYGFTFTVPLGGADRWARIFRPARSSATHPAADTVAARVLMRQVAFSPAEIRIRAGETVEWVNAEPLVHTVTADDGSWASPFMSEGDRFTRRFDAPGRYPYHCLPHPQMRGVVVVLPAEAAED